MHAQQPSAPVAEHAALSSSLCVHCPPKGEAGASHPLFYTLREGNLVAALGSFSEAAHADVRVHCIKRLLMPGTQYAAP